MEKGEKKERKKSLSLFQNLDMSVIWGVGHTVLGGGGMAPLQYPGFVPPPSLISEKAPDYSQFIKAKLHIFFCVFKKLITCCFRADIFFSFNPFV